MPGRKIDVTDAQYSTFRSNIPYMALLLVLHPLLRRAWNSRRPIADKLRGGIDGAAARFEQRVSFDYVFGLVYLVALHGFSALKVLAIFTINYRIATRLPRQYVPVATWVFNVSTLFANELCSGYHFEWMFGLVMPPLKPLGAWLDGWGGIMPRWEILFNITILRLISFNLDYYWSIDKSRTNALEVSCPGPFVYITPCLFYSRGLHDRQSANTPKKKQLDPSQLSERDRVSIPADPADYSMRNYIAYAAYAPLYLAGPILTFNDYVSQSKHRAASIETGRTGRYAVRFGLVLLAMELILHFNYVGAISKSNPKWRSYTAAELTMLSFMNLHIIWLKLLIPWRLFRLWALVDGVDPPENMVRCVSNNYSTQLFWRSWHRSYNRWLIRYIYVPMGGASFRTPAAAVRSVVTYLLVFTFVALWHDIQLRLLIWGWLIVFFMLPEWTASYFFPARKWESRPTAYRMLCCVGAVANVIMMIMANLVGFAVGLDGLKTIISGIMRDSYGEFSALYLGLPL